MTEETNYKAIKFSHSEDGLLPLGIGKTGFDALLTIGALIYTSKEGDSYKLFATDEEGLRRANNLTEEALGVIEDIYQTIGYLMAYVESRTRPIKLAGYLWLLLSFQKKSGGHPVHSSIHLTKWKWRGWRKQRKNDNNLPKYCIFGQKKCVMSA